MAYSPCMASWADDLYIATSVHSASTVLSVDRTLASIAVDCAAYLGLQLNQGPGKTVVVVVPRGAGTHALKRDLAMQSEPRLDFDTRTCGVTSISISCDYIHLGTLFDGKAHHSEIKRRSILSMPLAKQLRRPVFGKPSVSLPIRSTLFKSYVLSKLMFNFATRHLATLRDQNAWVASLSKMYGIPCCLLAFVAQVVELWIFWCKRLKHVPWSWPPSIVLHSFVGFWNWICRPCGLFCWQLWATVAGWTRLLWTCNTAGVSFQIFLVGRPLLALPLSRCVLCL